MQNKKNEILIKSQLKYILREQVNKIMV